jgi:inosine-uridine nucleoside N-ribohydrolase
MVKLHLDTDLGGDMDDLCALAMLLCWPEVEIVGVTTAAEAQGRRAGYARAVLEMAGRLDIPYAAGADASQEIGYRMALDYLPDELLWPELVTPSPNSIEAALDLMKVSIDAGATLVGTGPFTNFRLLEQRYPGILASARIVVMGGYVSPPRATFPAWGPETDYNVQIEPISGYFLLTHARPMLVPLSVTVETALRASYIPRLRQSGSLGGLLALQASQWLDLNPENAILAREHSGLPDDFINFQHDTLACAVAAGWDGVEIATMPLLIEKRDGLIFERVDPDGIPYQVVTSVQGERFNTFWLDCVTHHR